MNHVSDLLRVWEQIAPSEAVLATVVQVEGSGYRQPGARMLIQADGQSVGMLSGGCLERHVVQRAFWLTQHGSTLQTYQTGDQLEDIDDADQDLAFGLGCNGTLHVLFERLDQPAAQLQRQILQQVIAERKPAQLYTVIQSTIDELPIGYRVAQDGFHWQGQIVSQEPASRKSPHRLVTIKREDGKQATWLLEYLRPPLHLVICGAGQDSLPLVQLAKLQGWRVTIVDSRADYARPQRFVGADQVMYLPLQQAGKLTELAQQAAVAVMSHSLTQDRVWLQAAAQAETCYLGQLGPRYRTERLLEELASKLDANTLSNLREKLHYPIGLNLGGDTPEAVALAIVAEIQQVLENSAKA